MQMDSQVKNGNYSGEALLLRLTAATAVFVALMIALVPPVSYFAVSYGQTLATLESEAFINARLTSMIVDDNPQYWKLQEQHFTSLLNKRPSDKVSESRRIIDTDGNLIAQSQDSPGQPLVTVRKPIYDAGAVVGYIEITRSLWGISLTTLGIAIISTWIAIWSYLTLRTLPGRALKRALNDLRASQEESHLNALERDQAKKIADLRGTFMANMSHELRTPMNGVLGMLDLAKTTSDQNEIQEYIEVAHKSAVSLITIINDILDFSKIDSGQLSIHTEPTEVRVLLQQIIDTCWPAAKSKQLVLDFTLGVGVPIEIMTDPVRLRQILINLVGNAVKFTERGSVKLVVNVLVEDGAESLHFQVIDTGIGIPKEKHEKIFEPFIQADGTTTRKFGGTGLGLAISLQLVELLGGRLWVTSKLGEGSIFHLSLPMNAESNSLKNN
jgi:signal transduction histidine kinase